MSERLSAEVSGCTVSYNSGQETKDALFDKMLKWFMDQESFSGECIQQSDGPQVDGPVLLSEIADDIFQFDANYDF